LDRVEQWLDTIRSTLASLLDGDAPHRSLTAYSQYLGDHGPGPNSAFFVRLAIRALEDEQVVGATSQANALARLGATEALPALRQAAQRDYRDPGDMPAMARAFDLAIKTALNDAIARLEGRSAPQEAPPLRPAGPAVPLPPSRGGMTTDDLRRIEQAIGRPLPRAVREFFLHYPSELRTTTRDLGPTPDGQPYRECPGDNELTDNADHIIGANARRSGYDADWPDNMLVVGGGGCGETYWVDLDDESGAVYRFDAGTEPEYSDPVAGSLAEFARGLIDSYRNG
jgi:hypothetical protein